MRFGLYSIMRTYGPKTCTQGLIIPANGTIFGTGVGRRRLDQSALEGAQAYG